jgi:crotonobetainyl-CoA:carnitine CoA-transferase CaiB-like acyl-CoA transferase
MNYPEAKEVILRLTEICDVVMENFSPRVMSNWGLDYERLKKVRPDLIMVSISAMGQTGPWKDLVAYGPTLQALSGITYLTSFHEDAPLGLGFAYADPMIGLYAALAVLAALEYRDKTGQGQHIDVSGYEVSCSLIGPTLMDVASNKRAVLPRGNTPDTVRAAPYGCYRCSGEDRWCVIAVSNEHEWEALCRVLGNPGWTKEEKFSTLSKRRENAEELDRVMSQWTRIHTPEEVAQILQEEDIPAGVVQNAEEVARDPQLRARDFFIRLNHPILGQTISDRSPIRFEDASQDDWKAAPLLGEDNRYVYMELLGFTEEQFSSYLERKIIQ